MSYSKPLVVNSHAENKPRGPLLLPNGPNPGERALAQAAASTLHPRGNQAMHGIRIPVIT